MDSMGFSQVRDGKIPSFRWGWNYFRLREVARNNSRRGTIIPTSAPQSDPYHDRRSILLQRVCIARGKNARMCEEEQLLENHVFEWKYVKRVYDCGAWASEGKEGKNTRTKDRLLQPKSSQKPSFPFLPLSLSPSQGGDRRRKQGRETEPSFSSLLHDQFRQNHNLPSFPLSLNWVTRRGKSFLLLLFPSTHQPPSQPSPLPHLHPSLTPIFIPLSVLRNFQIPIPVSPATSSSPLPSSVTCALD